MPAGFNPYHEWLGLEDSLRPPNHYQLLGLEDGEDDDRRICAAADRAMSQVRSHRPGPRAGLWAKLLDEIADAKHCLTDEDRRTAYDQQLRNQTDAAGDSSTDAVAPGPATTMNPNLYPPGFAPSQDASPPATEDAEAISSQDWSPGATPEHDHLSPPQEAKADESTPSVEPSPTTEWIRPVAPGESHGPMAPFVPLEEFTETPDDTSSPLISPSAPSQAADPSTPPIVRGIPMENPDTGRQSPVVGIPIDDEHPPGVAQAVPGQHPMAPYASTAQDASSSPIQPPTTAASRRPHAEQPQRMREVKAEPSSRFSRRFLSAPILVGMVAGVVVLGTAGWHSMFGPPADEVPPDPDVGTLAALENESVVPESPNSALSIPEKPAIEDQRPLTLIQGGGPTDSQSENVTRETVPLTDTAQLVALPADIATPENTGEGNSEVSTPTSARPAEAQPEMQPTVQDLGRLSVTLRAARQALREGDYASADQQLSRADTLASDDKVLAVVDRLRRLAVYARDYHTAFQGAFNALQPGSEIMISNGELISVVEAGNDRLVVRRQGRNRTYTLDALPLGLQIAIAERVLDPNDPESVLRKAVFVASSGQATEKDLETARAWLHRIAARAPDAREMLPAIDDDYEFAVD